MGLPPTTAATGDLEQMSLLAGEVSGLIGDLPPAAELVERLATEARDVITARLR
jgi:nitronate monooxygenase